MKKSNWLFNFNLRKIISTLFFFTKALYFLSFSDTSVCIFSTKEQEKKCHNQKIKCRNHFPNFNPLD